MKKIIIRIGSVLLMGFYSSAWCASTLTAIEGVEYQVNTSMMLNLKGLIGKKVGITIDGGKMISGSVKAVSERLVHLEKIQQKEFFDALIRLEKIQAIEVQFRQYQR